MSVAMPPSHDEAERYIRWTVPVKGGEVPVIADESESRTIVILAHGAGGHMEQKTVEWLASLVRGAGARVVRFNFLYKAQGRSMPDRMPVLMATYRAVIDSVRERLPCDCLVIGGHSMGGRVASMIESEAASAQGLLLFGYPLHPAGQPEKLRDAHLAAIQTPTLQISGTEDLLCTRELMETVASRLNPAIWQIHWIEGADHSYSVKKSSGRSRKEVEAEISSAVRGWLTKISPNLTPNDRPNR